MLKPVEVTLEIGTGKDAEGKEKPAHKHVYTKMEAENVEDVRTIAADGRNDEEAQAYIVKAFNYGHDLILRQKQRQIGTKQAEGPEKQIAKAVDMLVNTAGFTAEAARAVIIAQRQAAGLPV